MSEGANREELNPYARLSRPTCGFRLFKGKNWGVMVSVLQAKDYKNLFCLQTRLQDATLIFQ